MKILLTGATGYIGKRLLPVLVEQGHQVVCCVRDVSRFHYPRSIATQIEVIEIDLLNPATLEKVPNDIDGAYYLVHSMSSADDYEVLEKKSATNFRQALEKTQVQHVVYLSGIINEKNLSKHLQSRKSVEEELAKGTFNLTVLRAGIIVGSGSASFEIIRDLVEKLPLMVAPKWLNTKCQPISISDVIRFLSRTLFCEATYQQNYDIGGPEIMTYKDMLLQFAEVRKLKRSVFIVPVMTPRLSSYWLYFVTSTSYKLAVALVNSMKVNVVCRDDRLNALLGVNPITYREALKRAFSKIESNEILSSWKDSLISGQLNMHISDFLKVPSFGCYKDERSLPLKDRGKAIERIWRIGGNNGWYAVNTLWKVRGFMDKLIGGVGLRRGRTNQNQIEAGDVIDFWRVLYANKDEGRLLLFAEMKLPGEAWLEFSIHNDQLFQTATFRPHGLAGRLYWYTVSPLHDLVFKALLKKLVEN